MDRPFPLAMGVNTKALSFMRYFMPWGGGMNRAGQTETSLLPSITKISEMVSAWRNREINLNYYYHSFIIIYHKPTSDFYNYNYVNSNCLYIYIFKLYEMIFIIQLKYTHFQVCSQTFSSSLPPMQRPRDSPMTTTLSCTTLPMPSQEMADPPLNPKIEVLAEIAWARGRAFHQQI